MERATLGLVGILLLAGSGVLFAAQYGTVQFGQGAGLDTFSSPDAFRTYLRDGAAASGLTDSVEARTMEQQAAEADGTSGGGTGGTVERYSTTNVQVEGIDEPDRVKTDGRTIYYARQGYRANTTVIGAFPPENASVRSSIGRSGQLLRQGDTLIVLPERRGTVAAYDVSDSSAPTRMWRMELNGSLDAARLHDGTVYLVVRDAIDYTDPCPVQPAIRNGDAVTIPCDRIHHPADPIDADVTYDILTLDPDTGTVEDAAAFVGRSSDSVVSMSTNALYLTASWRTDRSEILTRFMTGPGSDLFDTDTLDRVEELQGYDISPQSRLNELQIALQQYQRTLDRDERKTFETAFRNRLVNYTKQNMRDFQHTQIAKIGLDGTLAVDATGTVPGQPLNQFALDEYQGDLRIATTVDPFGFGATSENDVYVLGSTLERRGAVQGMGVNERVYAVRFIDDRGYVVTFRRIDPFHVLDLSDPDDPRLQGELKLPGFSSYLHPLPTGEILGIGEEDNRVKVVTFDVSDPANPVVGDDYILDEFYSAVSQSHHAFLIDEKHGVFFLPASGGGYVFSYEGGLTLEKAVDVQGVQRARYINDYLYILGQDQMVVLDETTWERVRTLDLPRQRQFIEPIPHPPLR